MFGKILLGIAAGVGAVALAPFTGGGSLIAVGLAQSLVGAGALAAGAGAVGGVAGAIVADIENDDRNEERKSAKEKGFSDGFSKGQEEAIKKLTAILVDISKRDKYLIAMAALCYAIANCDGSVSEAENDELDHYLNYIITNGNALSPEVRRRLEEIKERKDGFETISVELDNVLAHDLTAFDEIVMNIIDADGMLADNERIIKSQWTNYCAKRNA